MNLTRLYGGNYRLIDYYFSKNGRFWNWAKIMTIITTSWIGVVPSEGKFPPTLELKNSFDNEEIRMERVLYENYISDLRSGM